MNQFRWLCKIWTKIQTGANYRSSPSVLWSRDLQVTFSPTGNSVLTETSLLWPKAQSQTICCHRYFPVSFVGFWCQLCPAKAPEVGFKPGTSLLWCNSANHGTTFPPAVSHKTQYFHRTNASLSYYSQVIMFCSPVLLASPSPAHFTGTSNHVARRSVRQNLGGGWRLQHLVSPTNQFKRPTMLREHHGKKSSNLCLAKI